MTRLLRACFKALVWIVWASLMVTAWILLALMRAAQRQARRNHVNRHRIAEFIEPTRPYSGIHGRAHAATPTHPNPDCTVCDGSGTDPLFYTDCSECWPTVRTTERLRRHLA